MGRSIAQRLVAAGEKVVDVPAKLATRVWIYSTGHGNKTDRADAVAVGRAALHSKHLRMVRPDDENVALKTVGPASRVSRIEDTIGVPVASTDP